MYKMKMKKTVAVLKTMVHVAITVNLRDERTALDYKASKII